MIDFNNRLLARAILHGSASTVDAAFDRFHSTLTSTHKMISVSATHRASIEGCLKRNFQMASMFQSGSYGNGTNIGGYSDVDLFAVIPTGQLKRDSRQTLSAVAEALRATFSQTPGIRVDSPGIKIPFANGKELVEVIPADRVGNTNYGFPMFEIADDNGGWIRTSPDSHNAYVQEHNKRLGGKLKPLIRFIKAWKYFRNVPIRSFYLEMLTTRYAEKENSLVYTIDLSRILTWLKDNRLPSINDPRNISGVISPVGSPTDYLDATSKLNRAAEWADRAMTRGLFGDIAGAFADWDLAFNDNFPLYVKG